MRILYRLIAVFALFAGYTYLVYDYAVDSNNDAWAIKIIESNAKADKKIAAIEKNWQDKITEVDQYGIDKINTMSAHVADARSERDRLQLIYTSTLKRCSTNTSTSSGSEAAHEKPDLHANVFRELVERAEGLAGEADSYRIAGEACEEYAEAITSP